jgi:hypothetical protein
MNQELYKAIQQNVDHFLSHTKTWFHPRDIWQEYNIASEDGKRYLREILESKVESKELIHEGVRYRQCDNELVEVDWFEAEEDGYIKIELPFNLHRWVKLYPGVVVVAGEKGRGKTAFMLDCIVRNLSHDREQYLFYNDSMALELKERLVGLSEHYNCELPTSDTLRVYERFDHFGDVIVRDGINYVDYLDVNTDFYSVGQEIDDIYRATGNGLTFIGLQKNPKEALGVGGIYSWKRSQLYIVLSEPAEQGMADLWQGCMTLKRTRGRTKKKFDPTGMKIHYDIKEGCKFSIENI